MVRIHKPSYEGGAIYHGQRPATCELSIPGLFIQGVGAKLSLGLWEIGGTRSVIAIEKLLSYIYQVGGQSKIYISMVCQLVSHVAGLNLQQTGREEAERFYGVERLMPIVV
ncbi:hypothetical protein [Pyrobaculum sp.]|uniref:hypothetical protein n=1 Tax=Pyrobaculum sp. TaxID=2004705 RepID=UPI003D10E6AA